MFGTALGEERKKDTSLRRGEKGETLRWLRGGKEENIVALKGEEKGRGLKGAEEEKGESSDDLERTRTERTCLFIMFVGSKDEPPQGNGENTQLRRRV